MLATVRNLDARGVRVLLHQLSRTDLISAAGRKLKTILAVVAGFEHDLLRERIFARIARTRDAWTQLGSPPKTTDRQRREVRKLRAAATGGSDVARRFEVSGAASLDVHQVVLFIVIDEPSTPFIGCFLWSDHCPKGGYRHMTTSNPVKVRIERAPGKRLLVPRTFEVIVRMLKDRIFSGEFRPGDRLPAERELADELQVSRQAVREAYRALELVGIVRIRKGQQGGAFITERDRQTVTETLGDLIRLRRVDMSHLTEARSILEKDVAELAIRRINADEIAQLEACVASAIDQSNRGITATAENLRFHRLLGDFSGNPVLAMMLASTLDLLETVIASVAPSPEVSLANAEEHYSIITALRDRDAERLGSILDAHVRRSNGALAQLSGGSAHLSDLQARRAT